MPKPRRHPAEDPQPGDVILWRGWAITVVGREPDLVRYTASHPTTAAVRENGQDLATWRKWAPGAVVPEVPKDDKCLVFDFYVTGPCGACGKQLDSVVHVVADRGIFCPGCCPEAVHGKTKRRAKEKAA